MTNKFNKENTIIIIGKSTILDDPQINAFAKTCKARFDTIGINHAATIFKTTYFAFCDTGMRLRYQELHPNTKIIATCNGATENFEGEFRECFVAKDDDPPFKDGKWAYRGFTHDICLSWAIMHGYENVILIGVADFSNYNYLKEFEKFPDSRKDFKHSDKFEGMSIWYIDNVFAKHINIYTMNPDSKLNVPRISIKDLTN